MNIPGIGGKSASEVFDGIKSKLDFSRIVGNRNGDDPIYEEEFTDYEDEFYDDNQRGNSGDYDSYYDDAFYDEGYEQYAPTAGDTSSHYGVRHAQLVTSDDIKTPAQRLQSARNEGSNTPSYTAMGRELYNAHDEIVASYDQNSVTGREYVSEYSDFVSPYQEKRDTDQLSGVLESKETQATRGKSAGLDSLFTSTQKSSSYASTSFGGSREMKIIRPQAYGDVESIAAIVRNGDVVILNLKGTDANLSKRLLDFSFGVASALDARVECIADKCFAISKGLDLTAEETSRLRAMGIA